MHLTLLCLILTSALTAVYAHTGPVVDLGYARYQGAVSSANFTHFLGVRYAAAPVGESSPVLSPSLSVPDSATNLTTQAK